MKMTKQGVWKVDGISWRKLLKNQLKPYTKTATENIWKHELSNSLSFIPGSPREWKIISRSFYGSHEKEKNLWYLLKTKILFPNSLKNTSGEHSLDLPVFIGSGKKNNSLNYRTLLMPPILLTLLWAQIFFSFNEFCLFV